MVSSKDRKHSGRITSELTIPKKIALEENLEVNNIYYDEWNNYRDGFRRPIDNTKIRSENIFNAERLEIKKYNNKIKKKLKLEK